MLLCQLTTPSSFRLSLQRFRVAKTCPRMFAKLTNRRSTYLESLFIKGSLSAMAPIP